MKMAEEPKVFDDSKYSIGTRNIAKYDDIAFPDDKGKTIDELNRRCLLKEGFYILPTVTLPPKKDDDKKKDVRHLYVLQESHALSVYNPIKKRLLVVIDSCSPEKPGDIAFEEYKKELKTEPSFIGKVHPIVNKEMVKKEKFFKSVSEGFEKLKLGKEKDHYVSVVFFDVPSKKIDERSLEGVLTDALRPTTVRPRAEAIYEYEGQGYTYVHLSNIAAGVHTYPGLDSISISVFGTLDEIIPVLLSVEKGVNSKTKDITMRRDAWF